MPDLITAPDMLFDHVGIVVTDLESACAHWTNTLGLLSWTRRFDDFTLGVAVRFARDSTGVVYELISPLTSTSPVARAAQTKSNVLNQLAYRTPSLEHTSKRLRAQHFNKISEPTAAIAFGGAPVQFLLTPLGFLVELIEITGPPVHQFSGSAACSTDIQKF